MPQGRSLPSLHPEEWLAQRLINIAESDPRFEALWYGPHNALLSHYFPYQQRFLVKPQPKVRELDTEDGDVSFSSTRAEYSFVLDEDLGELDDADVSMTSMGGLAKCKGQTFIPDFIVTKATEFASHDQALLLAEVKVHAPNTETALKVYHLQIEGYMKTLLQQMPQNAKLIGLLICGKEVSIFRAKGPKWKVKADKSTHDINSATVRKLLLNIAQENWKY